MPLIRPCFQPDSACFAFLAARRLAPLPACRIVDRCSGRAKRLEYQPIAATESGVTTCRRASMPFIARSATVAAVNGVSVSVTTAAFVAL